MLFWARNSEQRRWNLCPHRAYILGENRQIKMENRHYVWWWEETEWGKEGWKTALRWQLQKELKNLREWLGCVHGWGVSSRSWEQQVAACRGREVSAIQESEASSGLEGSIYYGENRERGCQGSSGAGLHVQGNLDHGQSYDMYSEWHEAIGRILRKGVTWYNLHLYRIIPVAV